MEIRSILISQPRPESDKSPYYELGRKHNIEVTFRPFIYVESIGMQEFRRNSRVNIAEYQSIIFTSRNAVDHYFRMCKEMRVTVQDFFKYFCISEAIAYYLQKYVIYRKRKIFPGRQTFADLMEVIQKHKGDRFLLPSSDILKQDIPDLLEQCKINFTKVVIYRTVCSDLSDLRVFNYDLLVFFSPSGITSLFKNFPEYRQNNTKIAAFGPTTAQAVLDAGLTLDVKAPMPNAPSMTMALEQYIKKVNGKGKRLITA